MRLGEDDEVPGLGAEAEEEGPEAVVGGEDAPGAADGAGARGVERAQQAQDLGDHVGGDGVERAQRQRAVVLVLELLRALRVRAAGPRGTRRRVGPRRRSAREHRAPHLAEQHRHASAVLGGSIKGAREGGGWGWSVIAARTVACGGVGGGRATYARADTAGRDTGEEEEEEATRCFGHGRPGTRTARGRGGAPSQDRIIVAVASRALACGSSRAGAPPPDVAGLAPGSGTGLADELLPHCCAGTLGSCHWPLGPAVLGSQS